MKPIELEVIDYGYNGEGICKNGGKVFFVPKTIVGEKILAKPVKENSKFSFCKTQQILKPSSKRTSPPCPYFENCGGCNFQHLTYNNELELKKMLFIREFSKVKTIENIDIVTSDEYGYRNKVRLKVKNKSLGFCEEKTNNFIKIDKCLLCNEKMNTALSEINEFLSKSSLVFDEVIIYSFNDRILVDFVSKNKINEKAIRFSFPFFINHNGSIKTQFMGLKYEFHGDSFRQVNDFVAESLYNEVINAIKNKVVINSYSGAGVLSGLIAKKAKKVYGIELNKSAHSSAESLKKENKILNLINICGYAENEIQKITDVEFIVLDPPRAGCDKNALEAILTKEIENIIYISCNPATLTRDLKILKLKYDVKKVKLFDMFPKTANIEAFVVLKLKRLTK